MIVGVPGTGIGGVFYLLSALALPVRQVLRCARDRATAIRWRVVAAQAAMAGGILAGMWATGFLLGALLGTVARAHAAPGLVAHSGNVLRTATVALSFGTLIVVLLGVELLRVCLRTPARIVEPMPRASARRTRRRAIVVLVVLEIAAAAHPAAVAAQNKRLAAARLAHADSVFHTGNAAVAELAYAAVLDADSQNSRATYRLADLRRRHPQEALRLFRRYVALEPSDPWGHMAVADMLARLGRYGEALRWSTDALRLAPTERDAVIGRARVLARGRRTDGAVAAYQEWLATHDRDAEAWRELARELVRAGRPADAVRAFERAQAAAPDPVVARRLAAVQVAAAPAIIPLVSGSRDSDGNTTLRLGGALELAANRPLRLSASVSREQVRGGSMSAGVDALTLTAAWQPRAVVKVDATAGVLRLDAVGGVRSTVIPTIQFRARWRAPALGPVVDLRADRILIDASPLLVANRVVRTELRGMIQVPVRGGLRVRALGRTAALSNSSDVNHRTSVGGVLAFAATPAVELSGQVHQVRFDHPSAVGYFAPRLGQVVEAGTYIEIETGSVLLALDAGAGLQRVALHGAPVGPWTRAFRLYTLLAVPLAPGRDLRLEIESEDSQMATEAATSGQWRYGSVVLSLRWALAK